MVGGGAASPSGLPGPSDGAGDRGDPPALPGQEEAHPGRHRGQKTLAAELLTGGRAELLAAASASGFSLVMSEEASARLKHSRQASFNTRM